MTRLIWEFPLLVYSKRYNVVRPGWRTSGCPAALRLFLQCNFGPMADAPDGWIKLRNTNFNSLQIRIFSTYLLDNLMGNVFE